MYSVTKRIDFCYGHRLLDKTEAGARPVRLLGVSVHNFTNGEGLLPFDESGNGVIG